MKMLQYLQQGIASYRTTKQRQKYETKDVTVVLKPKTDLTINQWTKFAIIGIAARGYSQLR